MKGVWKFREKVHSWCVYIYIQQQVVSLENLKKLLRGRIKDLEFFAEKNK
jgi:hypothetical protein